MEEEAREMSRLAAKAADMSSRAAVAAQRSRRAAEAARRSRRAVDVADWSVHAAEVAEMSRRAAKAARRSHRAAVVWENFSWAGEDSYRCMHAMVHSQMDQISGWARLQDEATGVIRQLGEGHAKLRPSVTCRGRRSPERRRPLPCCRGWASSSRNLWTRMPCSASSAKGW